MRNTDVLFKHNQKIDMSEGKKKKIKGNIIDKKVSHSLQSQSLSDNNQTTEMKKTETKRNIKTIA